MRMFSSTTGPTEVENCGKTATIHLMKHRLSPLLLLLPAFLTAKPQLLPVKDTDRITPELLQMLELRPREGYHLRFTRFTGQTREWHKLKPFARKLTGLSFDNCPHFQPWLLKQIAFPRHLRTLDISFCPLSDGGMLYLTPYRQLTSLTIVGTRITDAGISRITAFTNLTYLRLGKNHSLTGRTLALLSPLKNLRKLYLWETGIRGEDLGMLAAFPRLTDLSVAKLIRGRGMEHLAALPGLRFLDAGNNDISNEDLRHLLPMKQLRFLNLSWCTIDDGAVPQLAQLRGLTMLFLNETRITPAGIARLQAALPGCRIFK